MCQLAQDVCLGPPRGVTGLVVNGKRDERQEEVDGNGDEGQGQTDCPGATAHTPYHPTERRMREDFKTDMLGESVWFTSLSIVAI